MCEGMRGMCEEVCVLGGWANGEDFSEKCVRECEGL